MWKICYILRSLTLHLLSAEKRILVEDPPIESVTTFRETSFEDVCLIIGCPWKNLAGVYLWEVRAKVTRGRFPIWLPNKQKSLYLGNRNAYRGLLYVYFRVFEGAQFTGIIVILLKIRFMPLLWFLCPLWCKNITKNYKIQFSQTN